MSAAEPQPVTFWFDPVSPFGYIGSVAIERAAARHGRRVDWRPFLIGVTVLKVMGMRPLREYPLKGPYLERDMMRLAGLFGVPLKPHGLTGVNSLAACRAFLWLKARDPALAKTFAQRIYAKLWTRGEDITSAAGVAAEAAALGADSQALMEALSGGELKRALQDSVEAAIAAGVFGAPTFIADGEMFWGADHIWMLEHWLAHHNFAPLERG